MPLLNHAKQRISANQRNQRPLPNQHPITVIGLSYVGLPPADGRNSLAIVEVLEAAETQVWLEFSVQCDYLDAEVGRELYITYDNVLGKLVNMIMHPEQWTIGGHGGKRTR